ncbi:MAG: DAK2 domain-containing protein [Veillonellaceae bacterium]|jgi:DAK2 domain fusion protein YloV|nr:DAK2 domain-containing protein [Veillonellaceae bacterium]
MVVTSELISGNDFKRMVIGAYNTFLRQHEYINSLNIFPVPDGDTGTNMLLTLGAVARALKEAPDGGIGAVAKRAADSAIMGARGNSGVILAQIFRGIARGLAGKEQAVSSEIGKAFQYGVLYAYRAVSRPVEGTILTVAKGIAKGTRRAVRENLAFSEILQQAITAGEEELARTPELLPVLKSAGVVDAGGKGLIVFLIGCLEGLDGTYAGPEANFDAALTMFNVPAAFDTVHPYCTEFIVKPFNVTAAEVRQQLEAMGDSLVIAESGNMIKIHIHSAHPGAVLESAVTWGTLHDIKIDNMADQHRHVITPMLAKESLAVISVAPGEGLEGIMRQLGASLVISGGQTMNPPVEDFMDAIHSGNAERYILLPNNKNIMLACEQVKKLVGDRVEIVPSANVPQGLAAIMAFTPGDTIENNVAKMKQRLELVNAAAVTIAVRDSKVDERKIRAGRYIGTIGNQVIADAENIEAALADTVAAIIKADSEVISLYYGAGLGDQTAELLKEKLAGAYPDKVVELYYGGQPHYQFIISVE